MGLGTMTACFPSAIFKNFDELKRVISANSNHNRMMILISGFVAAMVAYRLGSKITDYARAAGRFKKGIIEWFGGDSGQTIGS